MCYDVLSEGFIVMAWRAVLLAALSYGGHVICVAYQAVVADWERDKQTQ